MPCFLNILFYEFIDASYKGMFDPLDDNELTPGILLLFFSYYTQDIRQATVAHACPGKYPGLADVAARMILLAAKETPWP